MLRLEADQCRRHADALRLRVAPTSGTDLHAAQKDLRASIDALRHDTTPPAELLLGSLEALLRNIRAIQALLEDETPPMTSVEGEDITLQNPGPQSLREAWERIAIQLTPPLFAFSARASPRHRLDGRIRRLASDPSASWLLDPVDDIVGLPAELWRHPHAHAATCAGHRNGRSRRLGDIAPVACYALATAADRTVRRSVLCSTIAPLCDRHSGDHPVCGVVLQPGRQRLRRDMAEAAGYPYRCRYRCHCRST